MKTFNVKELRKIKFHPLPYTHITPSDVDAESYKRGWNDAVDSIMENASTLILVKIGHWIDPAAADCYKCSVCEEYTQMEMPRLLYHYCPNCGAKMDEEENDE